MSDLLPCAHCGKQPRLISELRLPPGTSTTRLYHQVACACSAQTGISQEKRFAVEMWNRRAPVAPVRTPVDPNCPHVGQTEAYCGMCGERLGDERPAAGSEEDE